MGFCGIVGVWVAPRVAPPRMAISSGHSYHSATTLSHLHSNAALGPAPADYEPATRVAKDATSVLEAGGHARTPDCGNSVTTEAAIRSGRHRSPEGRTAGAAARLLHDEPGSRLC